MAADDSETSFPLCPQCARPVTDVTTTGPHTHYARPCGCRLSLAAVQRMQ